MSCGTSSGTSPNRKRFKKNHKRIAECWINGRLCRARLEVRGRPYPHLVSKVKSNLTPMKDVDIPEDVTRGGVSPLKSETGRLFFPSRSWTFLNLSLTKGTNNKKMNWQILYKEGKSRNFFPLFPNPLSLKLFLPQETTNEKATNCIISFYILVCIYLL